MRRKETCRLSLLIRFNVGEPTFFYGPLTSGTMQRGGKLAFKFRLLSVTGKVDGPAPVSRRALVPKLVPKAGRKAAAKLPQASHRSVGATGKHSSLCAA